MEKSYWKIVLCILIFLSLIGAGSVAVYYKLKRPVEEPAELSKTETFQLKSGPEVEREAGLETAKEKSENPAPKKEEAKKEEPKRIVPKKASKAKEVPKESVKPEEPIQEKKAEVQASPPETKAEDSHSNIESERPSMGISLADKDKKAFNWSLGLLAEANMNTPDGYAMGTGLYTLFMLPIELKIGHLSLGAKALYSYDFKKHHIFDAALLCRCNFYDFVKAKKRDSGFFIQLEGGAVFGLKEKKKPLKPFMYALGEAAFGYRFTIKKLFIEPYIRGGYPVIWAIGISGGIRI